MKYVAAGNFMLDRVKFFDGSRSPETNLGGPATFAYSGIKLFTDDVLQCSNIGLDGWDRISEWSKLNDIDLSQIKIKVEHSNHSFLEYYEDGTYGGEKNVERFRDDWIQDFGYMKTSPSEIGNCTKYGATKGVYIAQNVDSVFWNELSQIKERDGFKLMWEIEGPSSHYKFLNKVIECCKHTDIFSINIQEAQNLFNKQSEKECIEELQKLPVDMTVFRVGARGLYMVTSDTIIYLPPADMGEVIDPTGCGNTSTGSALYAYCEFGDPLTVGVYANLGAAQNIKDFGVIKNMKEVREETIHEAERLIKLYRKTPESFPFEKM